MLLFWYDYRNFTYLHDLSLRLDVAVEFCLLMSCLTITIITFKRLLNSVTYILPLWAVCEDFPVVAHVSSLCRVVSMSEANTHTWRSYTNAAYGLLAVITGGRRRRCVTRSHSRATTPARVVGRPCGSLLFAYVGKSITGLYRGRDGIPHEWNGVTPLTPAPTKSLKNHCTSL